MIENLPCFKAYDIRGKVPEELNAELVWKLGRAYAAHFKPNGPMAVGRDVRLSSEELSNAMICGLNKGGVDTRDIGLAGTEMVYYAAALPGMAGGIMITASHNPMGYNGLKLVRENAIPISGDSGLKALEQKVRENDWDSSPIKPGKNETWDLTRGYIDKILSFINPDKIRPMRIVANSGNGCVGPFLDALAERLPMLEFIRVNHQPDGTFPNGVPNPLLEENRAATYEPLIAEGADLGLAWDGDFDRCFFFDEKGEFADGYYIVGLLASRMLEKAPGATVIHDPRMTWNTIEMVNEAGGKTVQCKTGHAFMKERMRKENAIYGGEMSAHHYFRDFAYCDSGMLPWLVLLELLGSRDCRLCDLIAERRNRYPSSGEINRRVENAAQVIADIRAHYENKSDRINVTDGLSMEFGRTWRFNLRSSQTEPILRLNVEAAGNKKLMKEKTEELLRHIGGRE